MILWRAMQDCDGLFEGACITDQKYKKLSYLSRSMYEPIDEDELGDWIVVSEENYCQAKGIEKLIFLYAKEVKDFLVKLKHVTDSN